MTTLTSGDLRIAKKRDRDGRCTFKASRDPKKLQKFGAHNDEIGTDDEDELEKKRLFKKC